MGDCQARHLAATTRVDLDAGANESVLAVSEKFGGWGFAARLEPVGPEYEPERQ